ncbi:MAG TPA: NADH-quinone oxidoreductase subunit J [Kofleriaceae bacterium]|nr:NADH-quinone oxidoreductase subunit J [Kofleriaceae bacterium]
MRPLALTVFLALVLAAPLAAAQPAPAQDPHAGHQHGPIADQHEQPGAGPAAAHAAEGEGKGFENGRGAALLFWVLALATVAGSIFVVTRRNLVAAVMGMVGTFFALAALYAMLYAHFLAVIQVLVYAGAIMVLFVFVVMILNRPEDEPWALQGLLGKALAGVAILYLLVRVSGVLWDVKDSPHAVVAAPRPQAIDTTSVGVLENPIQSAQRDDDWGSTRSVGKALFRDYLFPFEAVSLVLLVAVVGGIALSRPHREAEDNNE